MVVQIFGFIAFYAALLNETREQISQELEGDAEAFKRMKAERARQLTVAGRTLSGDFAFKSLFAHSRDDQQSLLFALENFRRRIDAEIILLVSLDNMILADTLRPERYNVEGSFPGLIETAEEDGEAESVVVIDGMAYQLVVVPLKTPTPAAWICVGFVMDEQLAEDFRDTIRADVSFLETAGKSNLSGLASTLKPQVLDTLLERLPEQFSAEGKTLALDIGGVEHSVNVVPLNPKVSVVLSRSLKEELDPVIVPLRTNLLILLAAGIVLAAAGALWISRSVTNPVKTLVDGVRRIAAGDFGHTVQIKQSDEIGELADSFNDMTEGLAERDNMRDLLGKVVSPEIAHELIGRKVELGGEERLATILFSDIRGFTAMSEKLEPAKVLEVLNDYLDRMGAIIENNGGVVDKYVGDAIMALFGVPLARDDDADRALRSAIQMLGALDELNDSFRRRGLEEMRIGIGINTDIVVAGNVGSQSRFNYTVIGDGVNLAARLEQLTKDKTYAAQIIVSESTAGRASGSYKLRHLGEVTVRGRLEPTSIYSLEGLMEK